MVYIKLFNTEEEKQACTDTYEYLSYTVDSNKVNIHPKAFFCKLYQQDGSVVEIEGSGALTTAMTKAYSATTVSAEIGELCTSIGTKNFSGFTALSSVTIPNSITSIGSSAFTNCSGLTNINIPSSVTSIGGGAFASCSGLISITVDSNNTVYDSRNNCNAIIETATNTLICGCKNTVIPNTITSIGSSAFTRCYALTSIVIPNSVTSIGYSAFNGCSVLSSITIPNSVTEIDTNAFAYCTSLPIENNIRYADTYAVEATPKTLTEYTIKESTRFIGDGAFNGCTSLTNITIPSSVTSIGSSAFTRCSQLTSITIPSGVTSIGSSAFSGCTRLPSITIPNSVTSISVSAFTNCYALTSINIPNSVISIGVHAFKGCSDLASVTIGNGVTRIDYAAFVGCTNLSSITSLATTAPTITNYTFQDVKTGGTLHVPTRSSGYDTWMQNSNYYLGKYNWRKVEQ